MFKTWNLLVHRGKQPFLSLHSFLLLPSSMHWVGKRWIVAQVILVGEKQNWVAKLLPQSCYDIHLVKNCNSSHKTSVKFVTIWTSMLANNKLYICICIHTFLCYNTTHSQMYVHYNSSTSAEGLGVTWYSCHYRGNEPISLWKSVTILLQPSDLKHMFPFVPGYAFKL